jgi:hypothetical protein
MKIWQWFKSLFRKNEPTTNRNVEQVEVFIDTSYIHSYPQRRPGPRATHIYHKIDRERQHTGSTLGHYLEVNHRQAQVKQQGPDTVVLPRFTTRKLQELL